MSRTVERRLGHGNWEPVEFMELTSGSTFRMYEQDGKPVIDQKGHKDGLLLVSHT